MNDDDNFPQILDNKVSISNLAARGAQSFSLREKRLFMTGLSTFDSRSKRPLTLKERTLRVTAADYAELSKIADPKGAYKDLKAACDNLFNRYLRYVVETPNGRRERKFRWVGGVTYHEGEGWVEFSLTEEIMPHLAALTRQFTTYRLRQASELRSVYSWRLLELLTSHTNDEHSEKTKEIDLDEFRHSLEVPKSYRYDNFKRRVILPAVKELTEKDGWNISWRPIKRGRKVMSIEFTYSRKKQKDLFRE